MGRGTSTITTSQGGRKRIAQLEERTKTPDFDGVFSASAF